MLMVYLQMNLNLKKKGINNVQKKEGEKMKKAFD